MSSGAEPDLQSVDRPDHAESRAGDARDDDPGGGQRRALPGEAGAQARCGGG